MNTKDFLLAAALASSVLLWFFTINAQAQNAPIEIGERVDLQSKVLNEDRSIFVSLPDGYAQGQDRYPVLYLLDGEVHFHHVSGLVQFLSRVNKIPPMIVIGVVNTDRVRDVTLKVYPDFPTSGGGEHFLKFFTNELIPFIDKTYRTHSYRILAGHSMCGVYSFYIMTKFPKLFNSYIAASPGESSNDNNEHFLLPYLPVAIHSVAGTERSIYFSVGTMEIPEQIEYFNQVVGILKKEAPKDLRWTYDVMPGETHRSIAHQTIERGLLLTYKDWLLTDGAIQQETDTLMVYFRRWGYDVPPEGPINQAGYRLLTLRKLEKAIEVFKLNCKIHPHSPNTFDSLGEALELSGDPKLALQNYKTAYRMAQENKDSRLEIFKSNYERLQKKLSKGR